MMTTDKIVIIFIASIVFYASARRIYLMEKPELYDYFISIGFSVSALAFVLDAFTELGVWFLIIFLSGFLFSSFGLIKSKSLLRQG